MFIHFSEETPKPLPTNDVSKITTAADDVIAKIKNPEDPMNIDIDHAKKFLVECIEKINK